MRGAPEENLKINADSHITQKVKKIHQNLGQISFNPSYKPSHSKSR